MSLAKFNDRYVVCELIDAAYSSGYLSGKHADGTPEHVTEIARREELRAEVLRRLGEVAALKAELAFAHRQLAIERQRAADCASITLILEDEMEKVTG